MGVTQHRRGHAFAVIKEEEEDEDEVDEYQFGRTVENPPMLALNTDRRKSNINQRRVTRGSIIPGQGLLPTVGGDSMTLRRKSSQAFTFDEQMESIQQRKSSLARHKTHCDYLPHQTITQHHKYNRLKNKL